jgi:hypothetical protein
MAENTITTFYDKQASEYLKLAGAWAAVSDNVEYTDREKYWAKALEYFRKAQEALSIAIAAGEKK